MHEPARQNNAPQGRIPQQVCARHTHSHANMHIPYIRQFESGMTKRRLP